MAKLHYNFIYRQIINSRKQVAVFILCVALSLLTLVSLGGFSHSVRQSTLKDARTLHAADIIIHSHYPFSTPLADVVNKYTETGMVQSALVHELFSMVQEPSTTRSLLTNLKVVEKGYPFYGQVELASQRNFTEELKSGAVIVEQAVLDRLQVGIGDTLNIGNGAFIIKDIVVREPDRPVTFFSFGPRIFISAEDLIALALIKKGSRIHYNYLLKVNDPEKIDKLADALSAKALKGQERVETYRTSQSGIKRFLDNFLFFLNLIGILTLVLAGAGIQSALTTLLRQNEITVAIMKTVGATSRFITVHFIAMVMVLGAIGTALGLVCGFILQLFFPILFAGILPANITITISWLTVVEGIILGMMIVGLFAFLPLRSLRDLKPSFIFRKESVPAKRGVLHYGAVGIIVLFFVGLVIWQLEDMLTGLYLVLALFGLIGITTAITKILLKFLRTRSTRSLALRQAFKGLFRPKNLTVPIIITLSIALAVIFSIFLIEENLNATFVQSYPPDLPNVYFLDIQPDQKKEFVNILGKKPQFYPVIRARITSINNKPINRAQELQRKRDNLAREFNLTYRDYLLEDERFSNGKKLFGDHWKDLDMHDEVPVSVLDTVAEIGDISMGDLIIFNVQGIPIKARVTSIRTRSESKVRPYFYFVFPEEILQDAPQTIFTAVRFSAAELGALQNKIVSRMPNISVIDISQTIKILARIIHKLSSIIQFFALFSIIAGLLITISSVFATQFARIQEAVYFKILGARASFILRAFTYENLIVAMICAGLAGLVSHIGSWIVCKWIFSIPYGFFVGETIIMMSITVVLIIAIGMASSITVLKSKPVVFLREHGQE